jgi:hypothetical protein
LEIYLQRLIYPKMDLVQELLERRRWQKHCLRTNIVTPDKIKQYPAMKVALCESNLLRKNELELRSAIEQVAPEWWGDDTHVQLKKNVQCEKHRDSNVGHSWLILLGEFTAGALL